MQIVGSDIVVRSSVPPDTLLQFCDEVLIDKLPLGLYSYTMPWTVENTQGLSWLGIPCISPMPKEYDYPHNTADFDRPMPHQIQGSDFLVRNPRSYLLLDMGGGKTLTALWAFDYLRRIGKAVRMLVICPKSIMYVTWLKEIRRHLPHLSAYVLPDDNPEKRLRKARTNVPIHILNHDGPYVLQNVLSKNHYDIIAYDESTAIKNKNTRRWRSVRKLIPTNRALWEMTGTPRPGTPEDAYGQIALMRNVDDDGNRCLPTEVLGEAFMSAKAWRDKTMFKKGDIWLPRKDANDTIFKYMQPAFCRTKRQMLPDLPPVVTEPFEADLAPSVKKALKTLERENKVEVEGGSLKAVNAGVLLSKVIQICCGVAYSAPVLAGADEGNVRPTVTFDTKSKDNLLLDLIDEQVGKSIVYIPFTAALLRLAEFLESKKLKVAVVRGATTSKEMGEIFAKFQSTSPFSPQVICAIPQKMSHGITATAASMTTWYSPVVRAEVYQQANNRMDRPGQKNSMLIGQLFSCPTEKRIFDKLEKGVLSQADLMAIYESFVLGS